MNEDTQPTAQNETSELEARNAQQQQTDPRQQAALEAMLAKQRAAMGFT